MPTKKIKALKFNQEILKKELSQETDLQRKADIESAINEINKIIIEEVKKTIGGI